MSYKNGQETKAVSVDDGKKEGREEGVKCEANSRREGRAPEAERARRFTENRTSIKSCRLLSESV